MKLAGSVAMVTGASSGIGEALALELGRRGAFVMAVSRSEEPLRKLCGQIGENAAFTICDVTREDEVRAAVEACIEHFGALNLLISNAGIGWVGLIDATPVDDFRTVLETNTLGSIICAKAALPHLRSDGGRIVFVASMYGRMVIPYAGAYSVSKHGLLAFADTLRLELRDSRIGVTTVCPSNVETPLWERTAQASGRRARMVGPVIAIERVVDATLEAVEAGRDELYVPRRLQLIALSQRTGTKAHRALCRRWLR